MKALIVKEDGLIYAAEVPEEPKQFIPETEGEANEAAYEAANELPDRAWPKYHQALASAKESAVLVSNHNQAFFIIQDHFMPKGAKEFKLVPGIYPIPDLQWEVKEELEYPIDHTSYPPYRQVAILKESTPSDFKKFSTMQEEPRSVASDHTELSIPPSTDLDFDINYDLEVLKEEMKELFNDSGERYTGVILSNRQAELMYNMIIRLETKLKQIWKE